MNDFIYWPYDEVSLEQQNPDQITIKTPWIKATTKASLFNQNSLQTLCTKLSDHSLAPGDVGLVNDFFRHFSNFPLAYILPKKKTAASLDTHRIAHDNYVHKSFLEITSAIIAAFLDVDKTLEDFDQQKIMTRLPRYHFAWDIDAALDFATFDQKIHPESIFSVARRYHILELMEHDRGIEVFRAIKQQPPDILKKSAASIVRKNHYVTEHCQIALTPALKNSQRASLLILDFMQAEKGHDKILNKALNALGYEAKDLEVSLETKLLMATLRFGAQQNFLSFAMMVDAFERNNYEHNDPIATLLMDGGFDKAAHFINLHKKINDQGGHDNIAQQFLTHMDLCDRTYATEALRFMEILSLVMCTISQS